jgi:hypothetical protein
MLNILTRIGHKRCRQAYGFTIDPELPVWENANNFNLSASPRSYFNRNINMKFHNLSTKLEPPPGLATVLGYDLKHCVQDRTPRPDVEKTFSHLIRYGRIKSSSAIKLIPTTPRNSM